MFEYGQIIDYIDSTYDENFNSASRWCAENNASLDELIDKRKEIDGVLHRYFQINKFPELEIPIIPEPTLEELKEKKKEEINAAREEARIREGAIYDEDIFDIDEISQSNILAQIKVAELLQDTKATYVYRSKTNKNHNFNVSQLQQLGLSIAQKVSEIYQKSWELKEQVDAAETAEEVSAIIWNLGLDD